MFWTPALLAALVGASALSGWVWQRQRRHQREAWIRQFAFPRGVFAKVIQKHPQLALRDMELVSRGLRQFFLAYLRSGRRHVSMPSQVADDLWHEFILYTRNYEAFCRKAFGGFLHHTPAAVLRGETAAQEANAGLRRCWRFACLEENIKPRAASRLPLLFALDAKYAIAGGFVYALDCAGVRREGREGAGQGGGGRALYCAGDFTSSAFDGSTDGLEADTSSDGGDGGDGGGDGSCGGGGCGGD
jgi:hypothetical protein